MINGVVNYCEDGTIFVANEGCVPGNKETCERDKIETLKRDDICNGVDLSIYPNPDSCTSYILCIFGEQEIIQCPVGAPVFNEKNRSCAEGNKTILFNKTSD